MLSRVKMLLDDDRGLIAIPEKHQHLIAALRGAVAEAVTDSNE